MSSLHMSFTLASTLFGEGPNIAPCHTLQMAATLDYFSYFLHGALPSFNNCSYHTANGAKPSRKLQRDPLHKLCVKLVDN